MKNRNILLCLVCLVFGIATNTDLKVFAKSNKETGVNFHQKYQKNYIIAIDSFSNKHCLFCTINNALQNDAGNSCEMTEECEKCNYDTFNK